MDAERVDFDAIFGQIEDDAEGRDGGRERRASDTRGDGARDRGADRDGGDPGDREDDGEWVDLGAEYGDAGSGDPGDDDDEDDEDFDGDDTGDDDDDSNDGDSDEEGDEEEDRRASKKRPKKESLREKAERADKWDRWYEEQQEANEFRALLATHDQQRRDADAGFDREIAEAVAAMNRSGNPQDYYWKHVRPLEDAKREWHDEFDASAQEVIRDREIKKQLPIRTAELCAKLGLPDKAVGVLLRDYTPAQIPREAKRMQREMRARQKLADEARQASRSGAARAISGRGITPGRGSGGRLIAKAGSDEELAWILAQPPEAAREAPRRRRSRR